MPLHQLVHERAAAQTSWQAGRRLLRAGVRDVYPPGCPALHEHTRYGAVA